MKKAAYIAAFALLSFLFVIAYYCCYYYASNKIKNENYRTIYETQKENPELLESITDADSVTEASISDKTEFVIETYNMDTNTVTRKKMKIPIEYIGMKRNEMIDYFSSYQGMDEEVGVMNIQLVSFSADSVVIRKSVESEYKYHYFIIAENGIVKVYHADKKSLYLNTGIEICNLEKEDKETLVSGFYVEDIKAMYNYLETITS